MNKLSPACKSSALTLALVTLVGLSAGRAANPLIDGWKWPDEFQPGGGSSLEQLLEESKAAKKEGTILEPAKLYQQAVFHYASGEFKKSLKLVDQLPGTEDIVPRAYYLRGLNYLQQDLLKRKWSLNAVVAFEQVIRYERDNPRAWIALMTAFRCSLTPSRNQVLAANYQRMKQLVGDDHFGSHLLSGTIAEIRTQYVEAEKEFLQAYRMAPQNPATLFALVQLYRQMGWKKLERSVICLRALVKLDFDPRFEKELEKDEKILAEFKKVQETGRLSIQPPVNPFEAYRLPFPVGHTYYLAKSPLNHVHEDRGEFAYDFLMPVMAPVCAARSGILKKRYQIGTPKYSKELVNFAVIDHGDGTFARYYNLRSGSIELLDGSPIQAGQPFARIERTRNSQSGHPHFEVVKKAFISPGAHYNYLRRETIPIEFEEFKGIPPGEQFNAWHISQNTKPVVR